MENPKITGLIIVIGVLLTLFLITLIAITFLLYKRKLLQKESNIKELENQKQIELIKAIVEAEERQKKKIASDLHDKIIPELTLKALNLKTYIAAMEVGNGDINRVKIGIDEIASLSESIREIVHGIIPKMFTSFGLTKSIEVLINEMNNMDNTVADFKCTFDFNNQITLSEQQQLTLYITCSEVLNNLMKHTKYNYLEVSLENQDGQIVIVFAHDGIGVTNNDIVRLTMQGSGIGLKSIQSRMLSLNGKVDYSIEEGVSFVKLIVPQKK